MPSSGRTPLAVPGGGGAYYQPQPRAGLGPTSSMRTTLNGGGGGKVSKEDLASYEAAVLARKTPINLNMGRLSSRRRGTGGNASGGGGEGHGLARASSSGENLTTQEFGMEGSALSGALGMSQQQQHQHQHQQQQQQKQAAARQFILHNNPAAFDAEFGERDEGASAAELGAAYEWRVGCGAGHAEAAAGEWACGEEEDGAAEYEWGAGQGEEGQ
ncbi:hypothetical protein DFP72DRAFT_616961 [Ephemerocybe angulata]|uniref:Uncharacterized protein n=1 Tax=Ephemerocybe angulata TaxID=980116 RepID=A0A8H6LZM3_9AGAR|nr:hypothetical protein DFP72DRAFT_616961 [Tulosesus angulatus]